MQTTRRAGIYFSKLELRFSTQQLMQEVIKNIPISQHNLHICENDAETKGIMMSKDEMIRKLTSRKFWLALAAMLGSIGTSIAGIQSGNDTVAAVGVIASVLSAAIYAGAEAYVDAARIKDSE